ncbi:MAG: short-chain dehydrogenase/reductase, partial [Glaciihabitans sp.]|nr:short-chain dehydrogenase/reductase [Glaciihabitans sp.]
LFDTHFFGSVSTIKAVLPQMRARRSGTIVNLSSIGAQLKPAGSGYYSAVKSAIEGLTGSLRKELAPLGITAMVVEPGAFRTDFSGRSLQQSAEAIADYAETAGKRRIENDPTHGTQLGDPAKFAQAIITAVESPDAPGLLVVGRDAVANFRSVLEDQLASLEQWRQLGENTDYDA